MVREKLVFLLTMAGSWLMAQQADEATYLKKSRHLEIDLSGDVFKVLQTDLFDKAFNHNFEKHTDHSVFYSDFDPVIKLEAETLIPVKGKMKHSKVSAVETKDMVTPGIFYGGFRRKDFVFPGVTSGSIGHMEVVQEIKDVHLISPFYFTDDIKVDQAEFTVSFPKNVAIQYRVFGQGKEQLEFSKSEVSGKILYRWTFKNVPPYKFERNSPSRQYSAPHIAVFIDSYETGGSRKSVLSGTSELYSWYSSLVQRIPAGGDYTELDAKIAELTKNQKHDRDKIKVIFQWVQQNIKYIAFEDGMAGFIPRAANDVYIKRFGDCKDMAHLLYYMVNKSGIKAHLTWIGTRDRPYTYKELPTPIADNHMICAVQDGSQYYFLDATNPFVEFGKPSSMIQGKEALIGIDRNEFKVEVVPVTSRSTNQRIDTVTLNVEPTGLRGTFTGYLSGYKRDDWSVAKLKAQVNSDREYVRDFFKLGDNNISIEPKAEDERGNAGLVKFNFFQPGYYSKVGNRLFINLNFSNALPTDEIPASREAMFENDYHYEDKLVVKFIIPDGYSVKSIPAETEKTWTEFGIKTKYRMEGQTIILERTIYCDYLYLDKTKFEPWNEFLRALTSINNQVITLSTSN